MRARLHIDDEETTIAFENDRGRPETVVLAFGSRGIGRRYFRHSPPTPGELEAAIAAVEDELMPAIPRLSGQRQLFTADTESVALARSTAASIDDAVKLDLAEVERAFDRLANVAYGRPASHEGIPERGTFAANLLILRELMHHAALESVTIGPMSTVTPGE